MFLFIKDTLLPFTVNSQEKIITTNKNDLQGDQTLDIKKDTINIKENLCVYVLVATAKLLQWEKFVASAKHLCNLHHRLNNRMQNTSSHSPQQPDTIPAISKGLEVLALRFFDSYLFLGSDSRVGHELQKCPFAHPEGESVFLLPYSPSQPSCPLPVFLLLLLK